MSSSSTVAGRETRALAGGYIRSKEKSWPGCDASRMVLASNAARDPKTRSHHTRDDARRWFCQTHLTIDCNYEGASGALGYADPSQQIAVTCRWYQNKDLVYITCQDHFHGFYGTASDAYAFVASDGVVEDMYYAYSHADTPITLPLAYEGPHYSDQVFTMPSHTSNGISEGGNTLARQHQQHQQELRVTTDGLNLLDPSGSASSSTPMSILLTPYMQSHMAQQLSIYSPLPLDFQPIASLVSPDKDCFPPPISPSTPHSADISGSAFGDPSSPLADVDEEPPEVMHHIMWWKAVNDTAIIETGTRIFIPQKIYQPYTEADRVRYIKDADLKPPIYFYSSDPYECAVSLDDALKARLKNLMDKEEPMFVGCGPSVSIRIQWPGYRPWTKQIPTNDFKTPKGPITKGKLAKNIATCIRRFIELAEKQHMEAESDRRWKVGRRHIKVEDLMLVSLHHVSKGSWQPQLRLRRAVPESSAHRQWGGAVASSSSS